MMNEIELLIMLGSLLLMALSGIYIGSLVLDMAMYVVFSSAIKSAGFKIWVYVILGVFGFFFEMNSMYSTIKRNEQYGIQGKLLYKTALGGGIGLVTIFPGYAVLNYLVGNYNTTIELVAVLMVGGTGFSVSTLMALAGAVTGRVKSNWEKRD